MLKSSEAVYTCVIIEPVAVAARMCFILLALCSMTDTKSVVGATCILPL